MIAEKHDERPAGPAMDDLLAAERKLTKQEMAELLKAHVLAAAGDNADQLTEDDLAAAIRAAMAPAIAKVDSAAAHQAAGDENADGLDSDGHDLSEGDLAGTDSADGSFDAVPSAGEPESHKEPEPEPPCTVDRPPTKWTLRMEHVEQYERAALAEKDPLKRVLAGFNAGLMRMAARNEEVLERANIEMNTPAPDSELTDPVGFLSTPLERLQRLQPMFDAHQRMLKLIMQLSKPDARFAGGKLQPSSGWPMNGSSPKCDSSPNTASALSLPPNPFEEERRPESFLRPGELAEALRAKRSERIAARNGRRRK